MRANEGLKKDLSYERGQKEVFQTVKTNLDICLKNQFQIGDDLKNIVQKEKREKKAIERELTDSLKHLLQKIHGLEEGISKEKEEKEACMVGLKTKQELHKLQKELKWQVQTID